MNKNESVEKFLIDLTEKAKNGLLDPTIGRDMEIKRAIQILLRRSKNNPILVGEPGVGKTAIAEGIAQRIINNEVPERLQGYKVYVLDFASVLAGASFKGQFEDRLKNVIDFISKPESKIITFIDEIHALVGSGNPESGMDASNILKPALARGELRCIGATTITEYKKYIERDPAFERRFQQLIIDQPNIDDSITILRGLKEKFEIHHGIRLQDDALISAVKLSDRYITNRFLPDKAIDVVDEAASMVGIKIDSMPDEIENLERDLVKKEIELNALEKDVIPNKEKIDVLESKISELKARVNEEKKIWTNQKNQLSRMKDKKSKLERLKFEVEMCKREGALNRASEILYDAIPKLEKEIQEEGKENQNSSALKDYVSSSDIELIVSKWTGIPITKLDKDENKKLSNIKEFLQSRIKGQEKAVSLVSDVILKNRAGLSDPTRPQGVFLFMGPTGVGKTELAKTLSEFIFCEKEAFIRVDMSEYMEKHSVSKLIGSPPGYVGFEDGGQLTEKIKNKPYSLILFDEIEKAHPEVHNILLQVFDDGRLTDAKGRVINFRNTIMIMTSNVGSDVHEDNNITKMQSLRNQFRPEFLNRIDEIVEFDNLTRDEIKDIVRLNVELIKSRLCDKDISLDVSDNAYTYFAENGYSEEFGARPVKRLIEREMVNHLSKLIISGKLRGGSSVNIDYKKDLEFDILKNDEKVA